MPMTRNMTEKEQQGDFEALAKKAKERVEAFNKKHPDNQWTVSKGDKREEIKLDKKK